MTDRTDIHAIYKRTPRARYVWTDMEAEARQAVEDFPALIRWGIERTGGGEHMDNFLGFLTPARRQAVYSLVAVLVGALLVFGVITEDQVTETVQAIAAVIAGLTALMAALNTNRKSQQ